MTQKLKIPIEIVKLSAEQQEGGYPFEAVILSGEPIDAWYGQFVVDLATVKYHKPRLTVNYNHNDELIIGYGENFQVTPEGLKSTGRLVAGSFADELVNLAKQGVPFEASVEIDLGNAVETRVGADSQVTANGRSYKGPISLYSDVPLRGYAICPLGADKFTNLTLLTKKAQYLMAIPKKTTKLSDDKTDKKDGECSQETTPTVKNQELADFCKMFGNENGLALFQSGADIAEAKQWQALNEKYSKYLSTDEETADGSQQTAEEEEEDDDKKDDKLSAVLTKLGKSINALSETTNMQAAEIVKLKAAVLSGGADPVSGGKEQNTELSAKEAYLASIQKAIKKQK